MSEIPFKPAWWLLNPHLQTLWSTLARRRKKVQLQRERIELADGDFVDLDWTSQPEGPIVLILHGLEGSARSPYAKGMLHAITHLGWRGAVVHFRGCSGEPNRLSRSYHSGDTHDFATILALLRAREPETPIAAIGYSMGGNVLLKWLGETGQQDLLVAAVAVSVPFELIHSINRLQRGFSRFYEWHFLRRLRNKMARKFKLQSMPIAAPHFPRVRTLREFDETITAPLHGFQNADDYYTKSSSRQYLRFIQVPTLLVQSKDDPFMFEDVIPNPDELSPHVQLEVTDRGGHVGFVSGKFPWRPKYWLEQRIPTFLAQYLSANTVPHSELETV